jgi:hypothetical protein
MLEAASNNQLGLKAGFFGPTGSGKSLTASILALGLAKQFHGSRPVAFFDTHGESDFVAPIFQIEGVPLVRVRSRSFADMRTALATAERDLCCAFIVDVYEHLWQELNTALRVRANVVGRRLQIQHRDELASVWSGWVTEMLSSPLHCLLIGRLSHDEPEDEIATTRPRGQVDVGYEAHLLLEMDVIHHPIARYKPRRRKPGTQPNGSQTHTCYVLKDRTQALNGVTFGFRDLNNYQPGDYQRVLDAFAPHVFRLVPGAAHSLSSEHAQRIIDATARPDFASRVSSECFFAAGTGESDAAERARRVKIAVEEIEGVFGALWPGRDVQSGLLKNAATDALFGTRSWTAVQHMPVDTVEEAAQLMRRIERLVPAGAKVTAADALAELISRLRSGEDDNSVLAAPLAAGV